MARVSALSTENVGIKNWWKSKLYSEFPKLFIKIKCKSKDVENDS